MSGVSIVAGMGGRAMISYDSLCKKVQAYAPSADMVLLKKAFEFSEEAHQGQIRDSGDPYFSHPLEVANILADMRLDVVCVAVGLLHDVVEDTLTDISRIEGIFGSDVGHIVEGVTKISQIRFSSRKEKQVENFRKLLLAMVDDIRVVLVKLADRLHNMRTLQHIPSQKQRYIARETLDIYAPIAYRLGIARIRGELEELAFQYLEPSSYEKLNKQVEKKLSHSDDFIRGVIKRIENNFLDQDFEITVQSRIKRLYSVYTKMKRQRIELDQVYDFIAFRLIAPRVNDCYNALGIINNMWNPVPGRIKDFIAMPHPNMYQSLHTTVLSQGGQPFEVQIRTPKMHQVAEEGIAAHWMYKEGLSTRQPGSEAKQFVWLRRVLEWQKEVTDPHHFLSNLKIELYPREVYIFTPKGEVVTLPKGATSIDFAYSIHTEVGNHCVSAKINGRLVALKSKLKNGDKVEILTSAESSPNRAWLEFAMTAKARGAIRRWLNHSEREQAEDLGRKLLEKETRRFQLTSAKYRRRLKELLPEFNVAEVKDLHAAVGFGRVSTRTVIAKLEPGKLERGKVAQNDEDSALRRVVRRVLRRDDAGILVRGEGDLMVTRSKCCNPIRGEDIVGYITIGRGVSVHAASCSNVENLLLNPERTIDVSWSSDLREESGYTVRLEIYTEDRRGMLADISNAISNFQTNIVNASAETVEGRFGRFELTVEVADTVQLEKVIDLINGIDGVRDVERVGYGEGGAN